MVVGRQCIGGVEAGGTKFRCAISAGGTELLAETTIPTTSPQETMPQVSQFFADAQGKHGPIMACGLAAFGPVELEPGSTNYGKILVTPKTDWQQFDILSSLQSALGVPIALDTDVNSAALAEWRHGAAQGTQSSVYVTVGTGIGTGYILSGRTIRTPLHTEGGHMFVPQDTAVDDFAGACSFHGACLAGVASGPAIEKRWGKPGNMLPHNHPAWALEAGYLAYMCVNLFRILSPEKIVLGGGVMEHQGLRSLIRARFVELMADYHTLEAEKLIVAPGLGSDSGLVGALVLADTLIDTNGC